MAQTSGSAWPLDPGCGPPCAQSLRASRKMGLFVVQELSKEARKCSPLNFLALVIGGCYRITRAKGPEYPMIRLRRGGILPSHCDSTSCFSTANAKLKTTGQEVEGLALNAFREHKTRLLPKALGILLGVGAAFSTVVHVQAATRLRFGPPGSFRM